MTQDAVATDANPPTSANPPTTANPFDQPSTAGAAAGLDVAAPASEGTSAVAAAPPAGAEFLPADQVAELSQLVIDEQRRLDAVASMGRPQHPEAIELKFRSTAQDVVGYYRVPWQTGPAGEVGRNGVQADEVLAQVALYLHAVNQWPFENEATTVAVDLVEQAIAALQGRTADREARGVEGTNQP